MTHKKISLCQNELADQDKNINASFLSVAFIAADNFDEKASDIFQRE